MCLIYSDTPASFTGSFDLSKADANRHWLTHYRNSLFLAFIMQRGTTIEKQKASKELAIAERKMTYWENHHNFVAATAQRDAGTAKKEWDDA